MGSFRNKIAVLMAMVMSVVLVNAQGYECCTALTILNDGSGTIATGVGEVYASIVEGESPMYVADTHVSAVSVVSGSSANGYKHTYYLWAKAKSGYKFVGWNTSKTSKTGASGSTTEGVAYTKTHTPYSAGSMEEPKTFTMYAIFEKEEQGVEPTGTDGIAMLAVGGNESFAQGSKTNNINIDIYFEKEVYFGGLGEGAKSVNEAVRKYITVTDTTGKTVDIVSVSGVADRIGTGFGSEDYSNGRGRVVLPMNIAEGLYTIHLPYSLFKMADGGVSAACDFTLEVTAPDTTPIKLKSSNPAENGIWRCNPKDPNSKEEEDQEYEGLEVTISLQFDQVIGAVTPGMESHVSLFKAETEHNFICLRYACPIIGDTKSTVVFSFGKLPNGTYTATIPAGIVTAMNGTSNEEIVLHFSVIQSYAAEYEPVYYTSLVINPAKDGTVDALSEITLAWSRDGYAAPTFYNVESPMIAVKKSYIDPGSIHAEVPSIITEDIPGVSVDASLVEGKVIIDLSTIITEQMDVQISIPEGLVYNEAPAEKNGICTNSAVVFHIYVSGNGATTMVETVPERDGAVGTHDNGTKVVLREGQLLIVRDGLYYTLCGMCVR